MTGNPAERPHPALRTSACDLFGIDYPIVQTGMGWVSTSKLTAATSEAGAAAISTALGDSGRGVVLNISDDDSVTAALQDMPVDDAVHIYGHRMGEIEWTWRVDAAGMM